MRRSFLAAGAVFLLLFGLHLAEELNLRSGPPSKTWSRSFAVGESDLRLELATSPANPGTFVFWVRGGAVGFARLLPGGTLGQTGRIPQAAGARAVAASPSGPASVFWLDGQGLGGARLAPEDGRVLERYRVNGPCLTLAASGNFLAVARPARVEVYRAGAGAPRLAASWPLPGVERLGLWAEGGRLHLALGQRETTGNVRLWLAALPASGMPAAPVQVGRFILSRSAITGLRVGVDGDRLRLVVLQETYGQRRKTTALQAVLPVDLGLPGGPPLAAEPSFTRLAPPELPGLSAISDLVLAPGAGGGLEAAAVATFDVRGKTSYQLVTGRLTPRGFAAPALATRAQGAVSLPVWTMAGGERLLVYQETAGFNRWQVRATGAGPSFRHLNRLRAGDLSSALLGTLLSLFSVFQALYYVTGTVFPGLVAMVAIYVFALTWAEHHVLQTFAAGAFAYLLGKVWLLPRTFYAAGVGDLLPLWLAPRALGYLLFLAFFALGCWAVREGWRAKQVCSPFAGLLLLAGIDLPLTLFLFTPYLR